MCTGQVQSKNVELFSRWFSLLSQWVNYVAVNDVVRIHQSNAVVDIIAAVFGVLENGTLAGFAGVYIATVVREIGQRNGRIWRIVSRAFGMKFFKAQ